MWERMRSMFDDSGSTQSTNTASPIKLSVSVTFNIQHPYNEIDIHRTFHDTKHFVHYFL